MATSPSISAFVDKQFGQKTAGFTPVRRPQQPHFNKSPAISNQASWTTTKCNRLIRPISSRIALLRKRKAKEAPDFVTIMPGAETRSDMEPPPRPSPSEHSEADKEWVPEDRPKKKLGRTYSARNAAVGRRTESRQVTGTTFAAPVRIAVPQVSTSRAAQAGGEPTVSLESDPLGTGTGVRQRGRPTFGSNKRLECRDSFRRLARSINPSEWMLYDGLYSSLDQLLTATAKSKPRLERGTRSLFASCLAVIPQYISDEQAIEDEKGSGYAEDVEDVANAIYVDLEGLGSNSSNGWKHLRDVARAHGIGLVKQGIFDGSIIPSIARGLILLCLQISAFEEAEALCVSLVAVMRPLGKMRTTTARLFSAETAIGMQTLKDVATQSGRWGFLFRALKEPLEMDTIPVEWMCASDMVECWNKAFVICSEQDVIYQAASSLVRSVVSLSYRRPSFIAGHNQNLEDGEDNAVDRAFTRTISNLMSVLLAMSSSDSQTSCQLDSPLHILYGIFSDLIRFRKENRNTKSQIPCKDIDAARSNVVVMAICLIPASVPEHHFARETVPAEIMSSFQATQVPYDKICRTTNALSGFLNLFASCWSEVSTESTRTHIRALVQHCLDTASNCAVPELAGLLRAVAMSAAFEYATIKECKAESEWAFDIEVAATEYDYFQDNESSIAAVNDQAKGEYSYRWEEEIGEWIAKTPTAAKTQPKAKAFLAGRKSYETQEETRENSPESIPPPALSSPSTKSSDDCNINHQLTLSTISPLQARKPSFEAHRRPAPRLRRSNMRLSFTASFSSDEDDELGAVNSFPRSGSHKGGAASQEHDPGEGRISCGPRRSSGGRSELSDLSATSRVRKRLTESPGRGDRGGLKVRRVGSVKSRDIQVDVMSSDDELGC